MSEPTIGKVVQDAKEAAPEWLPIGNGLWVKYEGEVLWTDWGMDP